MMKRRVLGGAAVWPLAARAAARPPRGPGAKIRYHSSTIRDHIEAPKRGPEHVITNSKNRFH
jgi:hypothetical protein